MQYPVSIMAFRFDHLSHQVLVLECTHSMTLADITAHALVACREIYRESEGWHRHHVSAHTRYTRPIVVAAA